MLRNSELFIMFCNLLCVGVSGSSLASSDAKEMTVRQQQQQQQGGEWRRRRTMSAAEVEIGVWVDGSQKWVSGVSRRTTCYDLISALLRAQNLSATESDITSHIIVERWKKVERPLDHEQRILKVWKSWGETVHQVRFSLRRGRSVLDPPGEDEHNPNKRNKHGDNKNKENRDGLDADCGSYDEAESSCGRSERSRRRHKMRQSRREAAACQQRGVHPLYNRTASPQPASDCDSEGRQARAAQHRKPPRDDPRYSETMERLMRLVVAQGETIQNQLRRLNQRETQIETYEQQMHLLRVQSLGNDYLLSSYLHDQQNQPQEYPAPTGQVNSIGQEYDPSRGGVHPRGDLINPAARNQAADDMGVPVQASYAGPGANQPLMHGLPLTQAVYAKPINLQGNPNDLFVQGTDATTTGGATVRGNFGGNLGRLSGRFNRFTNKDETISEEKSNDSGVVLGDDSLGNSVGERTQSEIEDFGEEDFQERIGLLSKVEDVLTRLLHEEEVIQGLTATLEVVQTQQNQETGELDSALKRAAEEHSKLVAEARSNEQQLRVLDTSAAQKKKLIDALLKDEVDSDQETKYLQAQLDYILHLPPTAFRLPEEGDDPPPLPPPPVHPACLVQSLLHHQPPQLVHPAPSSKQWGQQGDSTHGAPHHRKPEAQLGQLSRNQQARQSFGAPGSGSHPPFSSFISRPPSPNVLYANRAPSPTVLCSTRPSSPGIRYVNRSCSPSKRKPLQPPPYEHLKHTNVIFSNSDIKTGLQLRNSSNLNHSIASSNNSNNNNNDRARNESPADNFHCQNSALKSLISSSLPSLPNRTNLSVFNKNQSSCVNSVGDSVPTPRQRLDNCVPSKLESTNTTTDDSSEDTPPPLPLCPPPSLTPPMNSTTITTTSTNNNTITDCINNNTSNRKLNHVLKGSDVDTSKRNLLNSLGSGTVAPGKIFKSGSNGSTEIDDDSSNTSSLCVSSRSSTSSETSISNCSSSVSSTNDSYLHSSNIAHKTIQRINNPLSASDSNANSKLNVFNRVKEQIVNSSTDITSNNLTTTNSNTRINSGTNKKDPDGADSNSDTGLSSLHSSSDESGFPLDTLV